MGEILTRGLNDLQAEHPSVGEVRGIGLFQVLELVKNRDSREPMSPFNKPLTKPMQEMGAYLRSKGVFAFIRWNMLFACPPLIITEAQLNEVLSVFNEALVIADRAMAE